LYRQKGTCKYLDKFGRTDFFYKFITFGKLVKSFLVGSAPGANPMYVRS
jgi:hypothetical protein